jgi:hypothetical protein
MKRKSKNENIYDTHHMYVLVMLAGDAANARPIHMSRSSGNRTDRTYCRTCGDSMTRTCKLFFFLSNSKFPSGINPCPFLAGYTRECWKDPSNQFSTSTAKPMCKAEILKHMLRRLLVSRSWRPRHVFNISYGDPIAHAHHAVVTEQRV